MTEAVNEMMSDEEIDHLIDIYLDAKREME